MKRFNYQAFYEKSTGDPLFSEIRVKGPSNKRKLAFKFLDGVPLKQQGLYFQALLDNLSKYKPEMWGLIKEHVSTHGGILNPEIVKARTDKIHRKTGKAFGPEMGGFLSIGSKIDWMFADTFITDSIILFELRRHLAEKGINMPLRFPKSLNPEAKKVIMAYGKKFGYFKAKSAIKQSRLRTKHKPLATHLPKPKHK